MPSSGGKGRRRTRRGSRKAWSETPPERERKREEEEEDRDRGRGRKKTAVNGEKPGQQAVRGEATEVSGEKGQAAAVPTPLLAPWVEATACSLLTPPALNQGHEGLLGVGCPGEATSKGLVQGWDTQNHPEDTGEPCDSVLLPRKGSR